MNSQKFLLTLILLSIFYSNRSVAQTNNYFGTSGTLSGAYWSGTNGGSPPGTYTSSLDVTNGAIINFNNTTTTITGGSITVAGINVNADVSITTIGGTISNQSSGVIPIDVASGFTFNAGLQNFDGANTAGYIKNGAGVLNFSGKSYSGGFTLNAGTVVVGGLNAMGADGALYINGGTIGANADRSLTGKYTGGIFIGGDFTFGSSAGGAATGSDLTFSNNTSLGAATRTITIGGTGIYTLGGVVSGNAAVGLTLNATAAGKLLLTNANTYTGLTTVNSGATLKLGNATALGTVDAGTVVNSGGVLDLNGINYSTLEPLSIAGGGGGVVINSSATAATFSGPVTITANSTINASAGAITLNNASAITGTGSIWLGGAFGGVVSSPIATTGNLTKQLSDSWVISGANSYTGNTNVHAGSLILGAADVIPNASPVVMTSGILSTGATVGYSETAGTLDLEGNATIAFGTGSHTLTFADSHTQNWGSYTLNITGWNKTSSGRLFIGTDANGLTAGQLALITFSGYSAGAKISASGEIFPSTIIFNAEDLVISAITTNATSDMTIQSGGKLTVDGNQSIKNLTVETGGKIIFTGSPTLSVAGNVVYKADKTTSFSANIGTGSMAITGTVAFHKTMDKTQWFFMSFPCAISVNDIIVDGVTTGAGNATGLGTNWFIKYYDGATRIVNLGATTNWVSVAHGGTLTANKGYIIGLADAVVGDKVLVFPLVKALAQSETAPPVPIIAHGVGNGSIAENHKGWNLVGHPYLSKYTSSYMGTLNYVTLYSGGYYTVAVADAFTMNPFSSFFVQATADGDISFHQDGRQTVSSSIRYDSVDRIKLILKTATGEDDTNLMLNDDYSLDYKIGQDMEKWISTGTPRPQIYSNLNGVNYAFNGLPMANVENLPLGIYTNAAGNATISTDAKAAPNLSALILTDTNTGTTTDLLTTDYSFNTNLGTSNNRFMLTAMQIATTNNKVGHIEQAEISVREGKLRIHHIKPQTRVMIFDTLGRLKANQLCNGESVEITLQDKGLFIVQLIDGNNRAVKKIVSNCQ